MRLGKIRGDRIKEVEIMEEIKEKYALLENGLKNKTIVHSVHDKNKISKKWFEFWK